MGTLHSSILFSENPFGHSFSILSLSPHFSIHPSGPLNTLHAWDEMIDREEGPTIFSVLFSHISNYDSQSCRADYMNPATAK